MAMQKDMMGRAVRDSFAKLDPRVQIQNPVMFLVWLSAGMTSVLAVASIFGVQDAGVPTYYVVAIAVILWLTDLFSNFAEALAEGRGKAQADSLRAAKKDVEAHRIESVEDKEHFTVVPGTELTRGDLVIVRAGEQIPGDGDVIEGAASVDESAIIPALFSPIYPGLDALNILGLTSPLTAVLSAIIYNALVIVALIPAALKGVKYRELSSGQLLTHNLLVWGLGGIVAPFVFIKIIDMLLALFGIGMM